MPGCVEFDIGRDRQGVTLVSTPETFPIFTGTLFLTPNTKFEYKYAVVRAEEGGEGVQQQWEAVNRCRIVCLRACRIVGCARRGWWLPHLFCRFHVCVRPAA